MQIPPTTRRRIAAAAGGALVLGAGTSMGILTSELQQDWAATELRQQAEVLAPEGAATPEPVVVLQTRVRHITPPPVVVHRRVYRTPSGETLRTELLGGGPATQASPQSAGSTGTRQAVVPPASAPRPAAKPAPPATTSKTS